MDDHTRGYLYVSVSTLLISLAFIFNAFALKSVNTATAAFFLFGLSSIGSLILLVATRKLGMISQIFAKFWKPLLAIGILNGISAPLWLFLLDSMGPSLLSFLLRLTTIFMIVLGVVFLKERFTKMEAVGAAVMIAGTFVISYTSGNIAQGISLVLILSIIFSIVQFLNKVYIKEIEPMVINTLRVVFTFATVSVFSLGTMQLRMPSIDAVVWLALASLSAGIIGFILNYRALQLIDLSKTAVVQSLQPFVVVIYSFVLIGSVPSDLQLIGGIIIVGGALISVIARYKPKFITRFIPFG